MILYPVSYALSITNVEATDVTATSARVKWLTEEVADGSVKFGPTANLGFITRHSTYVFEHNLPLQGLESETTYFFQVESSNIQGQFITNNNNGQFYSFTTKDVTPPEKNIIG